MGGLDEHSITRAVIERFAATAEPRLGRVGGKAVALPWRQLRHDFGLKRRPA